MPPPTFKQFKNGCSCLICLFEPYFQWSSKADAFPRRLPMTLVVYHPDVFFLITHSFSLNDSVLTTLCLNPASVCASCCQWKKGVRSRKWIVTNHRVWEVISWFMWLIRNLYQMHDRTSFRISGLRFSMQSFVKKLSTVATQVWIENIMLIWLMFLFLIKKHRKSAPCLILCSTNV